MEEYIVSVVCGMIANGSYAWATGIKGKIKLYILKRKLQRELSIKIVKKYGSRVYYNALDKFITNNGIIPSLLEYCYNPNPFSDNSHCQTTEYYTNLFIEKNPAFINNRSEIYSLLMECYIVIFSCVNPVHDENVKTILAHINEQQSRYFQETRQLIRQESTNSKNTGKTESNLPVFSKEQYFQYVLNTNRTYSKSKYISRVLAQNGMEKGSIIDTILVDKKIIILGDAGFGKTNEAIRLLHEVCEDTRTNEMIPIYLPLAEYGDVYDSIEQGLIYRIKPFTEGDPSKLIHDWLKKGHAVIIFDGIDDIETKGERERFILEANDCLSQYDNNMFLFTSRFNMYHDKINVEKKYNLSRIDRATIRKVLQEEGIYSEIPNDYYELFSNPFFLSIGKRILKKENGRHYFNRSDLFLELFHQLYDGVEYGINKAGDPLLSSYEALQMLGQFAYENYTRQTYTYMLFDQKLGNLIKSDTRRTISYIVNSGLFHCDDGSISFSHKLLKEFCAAAYLAEQYSNKPYRESLLLNAEKREWKEVCIFVAGILEKREEQNDYLDSIMKQNLPLYIECVKSKCEVIKNDDSNTAAYGMLKTILTTYEYIINHYFAPISFLFDPYISRSDQDNCVGIRGHLSQNNEFLHYWFEVVSKDEEKVLCISQEDLKEQNRTAELRGLQKTHRFVSRSTNLVLSRMTTESGRLISIKLIYDQLNTMIEHRELIESKYLLGERLHCIKRKYKAISNTASIEEMKGIVDNEITEIKVKTSPNLASIMMGRVDLIKLQSLLDYMYDLGLVYEDLILPQPDIPFEAKRHGYIWGVYSKEQQRNRIATFLMYLDESYMQMTNDNFPALCNYFSKYKDHPCKAIVLVNFEEKEEGENSCPLITYYYEAIEQGADCYPEIREITEERTDSDKIFREIQNSYSRVGREVNNGVIHNTSFSTMLVSHRTGEDAPLSDAVYDALKNSIEEIFGKVV